MNNLSNFIKTYLGIFLIISIILLIISLFFPFIINHFFNDWSKSGTFGDSYGALNAIFSALTFAGLIVTLLIQREELSNQRKELSLQREEMKETRFEFLTNRITTLVYNQLERFEKNIENLTIKNNGNVYVGNDAINFLYDNLHTTYKGFDKSQEDYLKEKKVNTIKNTILLSPNKSEINKFSHIAYNSVKVLTNLLSSTDLEIKEIENLRKVFFRNIGYITLEVIDKMAKLQTEQIESLTGEDYLENNLNVGEFSRANVFLSFVSKVNNNVLTEENSEAVFNIWKG